jgi:oligopeptide transport system permease protein
MAKFIFRRALWTTLVLFVVSIITFVLMHQIPGGPFDSEKNLPQRVLETIERAYRLDEPLLAQYARYIGNVLIPRINNVEPGRDNTEDYLINIPLPFLGEDQGFRWMNFGPSFNSRSRSVSDIFREQLPVSFQLGLVALSIALAIGVPLGIVAAVNRNNWLDFGSMGMAIMGVSVPVIIMGPVLQYIFGVQLRILPVSGWGTPNHVILPAFALGFFNSALIARLTRASLLQVLNEDYIRTARAKGLSENIVILLHAMKNALIPVVTVVGPLFAALVTGTFVVETIFAIPGLGRYFITSITNRDYPVIMGTVLLYAVILVIANTLVDVTYALLDPRIRYD